MIFIEKTFDLKKCARVLRKQPERPEQKPNPDALTPANLKPCFQDAYIGILRNGTINIKELDFSEIGDGDIDDLENVLDYSLASDLFSLSDVFTSIKPSAAAKHAFI